MRLFLRQLLWLFCALALAAAAAAYWLFSYSGDLPNMASVAQFAPAAETQAVDPCSKTTSIAIPYSYVGNTLHAALSAAEGGDSSPGVLADFNQRIKQDEHLKTVPVSLQIARRMVCMPSRALNQETKEFRLAIRLERHYSRQQLFTIYANRVYLGPGLIGVQQGSEFYFRKAPAELNLPEAALLVGLIRAPAMYSPSQHPDRALRRRNEVIDAMAGSSTISAADAQAAKSAPLGIVANTSPPSTQ
jgi:penicillin-binding protein 1A